MLIDILALVVLIKVVMASRRPIVCALVYAALPAFLGMMAGWETDAILAAAGVNFAIGIVFFWLLERTDGTFLWWLVLIGGVAAIVVFRFSSIAAAEVVEGRVARTGYESLGMVVYDAQGRPYPNALDLRVDADTRFEGARSALDLRPRDAVSADISQTESGAWRADRVTRFEEINTRPATARPSPSLRDVLGNPVARGALVGAATGALASGSSGGKAGKGALIGAGVGAAAGLLESLFSQQPQQPQPATQNTSDDRY
jgi:hypothetical protein